MPKLFADTPEYWAGPGYCCALTRFCIWSQIYEATAKSLQRDCPDGALTMQCAMAHGTKKTVAYPSLDIMKDAEQTLRMLEGEFGLTPRGDSDLKRVETFNAAQGTRVAAKRRGCVKIQNFTEWLE